MNEQGFLRACVRHTGSSTEQSVISFLDTVKGIRSPKVLALNNDQCTEVTLFPDLTNFELRSPCLVDKGHRPW